MILHNLDTHMKRNNANLICAIKRDDIINCDIKLSDGVNCLLNSISTFENSLEKFENKVCY